MFSFLFFLPHTLSQNDTFLSFFSKRLLLTIFFFAATFSSKMISFIKNLQPPHIYTGHDRQVRTPDPFLDGALRCGLPRSCQCAARRSRGGGEGRSTAAWGASSAGGLPARGRCKCGCAVLEWCSMTCFAFILAPSLVSNVTTHLTIATSMASSGLPRSPPERYSLLNRKLAPGLTRHVQRSKRLLSANKRLLPRKQMQKHARQRRSPQNKRYLNSLSSFI